ncbi:hypothetical protein V511_13890 [Mesotoga sp. Brook.08.YT.4.2.5.1]|nr:hypothetical protein V511_13890 [Mesotoga sp. Brook.08.YT.4.2.5.1]PNS41236.1 hypothetical protein RJ60_05455 [Mesotoga sp. B105.6.4]PVD16999.1 hypothetical protein V512_008720 [Mesotoga sp. Brook.08.105.5.1]RAO97016.1 hypothetical protein M388_12090 [Mesotoga sp. Brook.08.YT.4.2.5.4.]RDI93439.1 hypothetical protein Q502_05585 [Mesotoga sp. Brook.08.YT.4.2.5.2.]
MLLIGLAKPKLVCANRQASKSPPAEGSLASVDVLSAPCVPPKAALRLISAVTDFSLAFSVSVANVSKVIFLD